MKKIITLALITMTINSFGNVDNVKALKMALDDEYKAKATYLQVMEDFGERRPFSNIVNSEERHIQALLPFFQKYGEAVPQNKYLGNVASYDSFASACQAGVNAEIENVKLYDEIYKITDDEDLIAVFKNLQWASQKRHLRAFKRCAR
jgi:hypothetical protein